MGLFETDADDVVARIQKWKPTGCATEAEYETALYSFLNAEFPKEVFVRQHVYSKTRADLYVEFIDGAKVAIELKADLTDRNEHHRVIGQLWTYVHEWKCEVVLVVCGKNDPALVKLGERFTTLLSDHAGKKARLVEVKAP